MYKYLKILSNFILVMLFSVIITKYLGQSETTRSATPNILRKDLLAVSIYIKAPRSKTESTPTETLLILRQLDFGQ